MKKIVALFLALVMVLSLAACGGTDQPDATPSTAPTAAPDTTPVEDSQPSAVPTHDRAGTPIVIPAEVETVISLAPATTQIIEALGMKDLLVAVDTQTPLYVEGTSELPQFDMMAPDIEQLAMLEADIVFTSGMSYVEDSPLSS